MQRTLPPVRRDQTTPSLVVPGRGASTRLRVLLLAGAVLAVRLPSVTTPASPDEGGFLLLAGQWRRGGSSLYGDYWVDRPPLLIWVYRFADGLGGLTALRLIGCVAAVASVVLAAHLTRAITGRPHLAAWGVLLTAALVTTPLFDAHIIDGELLALPWALGGLLAAVHASSAVNVSTRVTFWFLAGASATAAAMTKQSFLDVFVFAGVMLLLAGERRGAGGLRTAGVGLVAFGGGAALCAAAVLTSAAWMGTSPAGLWDAVVTFRGEAAAVISSSASAATPRRLARLPVAFAVAGGVVPVVALALRLRQRDWTPLMVATTTTLAWEAVAVVAGGSYWKHYLLGLVPGLVLCLALIVSRGRLAGLVKAGAAYAALAALVAAAVALPGSLGAGPPDVVGGWLRGSAAPDDTAVVLYGQPDILFDAGLQSPYPMLWSLQVRVRDPRLLKLSQVLSGPSAPDWVVVAHTLDTWGVDPSAVKPLISRDYRAVADVCGYQVLLNRGLSRSIAPEPVPCPS